MFENKIVTSLKFTYLEYLYGVLYKLVFYTSFIYIHGLYIHDGSN